ncbi:MAG TPA: cell division protein FtsL [Gammaproteobacteria bacterium]|nr:cell division protein FtsL [Gammaproteobacteria bacterium]
MNTRPVNVLVVLLAVVVTAVGIVYSKHKGRGLFVELQMLGNERDRMDVEWGQLQLEQSTLTTQGKVESAARDQLGMVTLSAGNMVIVKP